MIPPLPDTKDTRTISRMRIDSREGFTFNAINCGSLQRIADALEISVKSNTDLLASLEFHKRRCKELDDRAKGLQRSIIAYRANLTRTKGRLAIEMKGKSR